MYWRRCAYCAVRTESLNTTFTVYSGVQNTTIKKGYNQFSLRRYVGYLPPRHTVSLACTKPAPVVEWDCSGKLYKSVD